jgi:hypothetical protein
MTDQWKINILNDVVSCNTDGLVNYLRDQNSIDLISKIENYMYDHFDPDGFCAVPEMPIIEPMFKFLN